MKILYFICGKCSVTHIKRRHHKDKIERLHYINYKIKFLSKTVKKEIKGRNIKQSGKTNDILGKVFTNYMRVKG